MATSLIASLAWLRFREGSLSFGLCEAAAFMGLAICYAHAVALTIRLDLADMLATRNPGRTSFTYSSRVDSPPQACS